MTNLRLLCILIVLAAVCWQAQSSPEIVKVNNGGPWGSWGKVQMCPKGSFAGGFSIRVEKKQGSGDDTSLNGIRLHCYKAGKSIGKYVQSHPGYWGGWSRMKPCPEGLTRFMLKVEGKQGTGDDTAATNIIFTCGPRRGLYVYYEAGWGKWGAWSRKCSKGKVICGLRTKVEAKQGGFDDTALNDVRFYCCQK